MAHLFSLIIIIIVFNNNILQAQNPKWAMFYTGNSSLKSNNVISLCSDSNNVWLGTDTGGFSKYNYNEWINYDKSNSQLNNNFVLALHKDHHDRIWIGTADDSGGVYVYDSKNPWQYYHDTLYLTENTYVTSIKSDKSNNVWISTYGGIIKFDGINWIKYTVDNMPLPIGAVEDFDVDGNNNLWLSNLEDIVKIDLNTNKGVVFDSTITGAKDCQIRCVHIDKKGILWFGTWGCGLFSYDGETWKNFNTSNSGINDDVVLCIDEDKDGTLWFGTSYGVAFLKKDVWGYFNSDNSILLNTYVHSITIDSLNNIWFGTVWFGVYVYNPNGLVLHSEDITNNDEDLFIFPNPTSNVINVKFTSDVPRPAIIRINDVFGKEVAYFTEQYLTNSYEIKINYLPDGIYFYKIQTGDKIYTGKFVKME